MPIKLFHFKISLRRPTCTNGRILLPLFLIDLCPQVMQTALLLLLVAPLAGLAAPVEKPSTPYYLVNAEGIASDFSPTCYRRWRHHGHLTFRLARVQSCSRPTDDKRDSPTRGGTVDSKYMHHRHAIPWVG